MQTFPKLYNLNLLIRRGYTLCVESEAILNLITICRAYCFLVAYAILMSPTEMALLKKNPFHSGSQHRGFSTMKHLSPNNQDTLVGEG